MVLLDESDGRVQVRDIPYIRAGPPRRSKTHRAWIEPRRRAMNIQQLRYVVATAEHGSMTAAATALFVAQPALSRAVRQLERELEVALFARAGRGVALTAEGEQFVIRARAVLRNIEALRDVGAQETAAATLVIAASPTLQASMALPILEALRHQGIDVHTRLLGASGTREVHALV